MMTIAGHTLIKRRRNQRIQTSMYPSSNERLPTWNPSRLMSSFQSASITHRVTCKQVAVAGTNSKDIKAALKSSVSTQLLGQLDALLPSGTPGQHRRRIEGGEQKKNRMKPDSDVSRMSPSMRSHLESLANLKGEQVAAKVTQEDAGKDEWFVVKVIHFEKETREFEVLDEEPGDDEESGGQRKYKLPMSHIIPFPKRTDPSSGHDFPPGKHVLALCPETTALYKATVVQARKRKTDDYVLEFDDDEEEGTLPQRLVPFHRVVPLPEGYQQ